MSFLSPSSSLLRHPSSLPWSALALAAALAVAPSPSAWAETPSCHDAPAMTADHDAHAGHAMAADTADEPETHAHPAAEPSPTDGESHDLRLPNVPLVDQDGHPVDLYQDLIEDKVVAMSFIFTSCTTICPPMGASFGKLQGELGELLGREVGLVSVSIDPTTDTPQRLKKWAAQFGASEDWTLLTGSKQDVDQVLRALEVFTPTTEDHGPFVLLGNDRSHRWMRVNGLTPPAKLASILKDLVEDGRPNPEGDAR